jgi:RNA polymerase sigma-70 factor (ECF subfamily)
MLARQPDHFRRPVKIFGSRRVLPEARAAVPGAESGPARFEAFVRLHQHMVFSTAVRLLGRSAEAEDVSQDVFLKAYEHFDRIGDSPTAAGWLRTVTRNACLNHLTRYRARWRLFSEIGREGEDFAGEHGVAVQPFEAGRGREDEASRLEGALRGLPDAQRVPLVLYHFEDASYEEIAQTLGVSLGKVKTDIHRGREALKALLTRDGTR